MPINKLFEKSGVGNNNSHPIRPAIIDIYAVFSLKFFE